MPLLDALKALHTHRFDDPNFVVPQDEDEKSEIDKELSTVRHIIESLLENDSISEELKIIDFQRRMTMQEKSFTSEKAVKLILASCTDAQVPLKLEVFHKRKK